MQKYNAVIFDLDGVIVDTAKYHYLAWKRLADELGFEFLETHNERLKGVSRMDSLNILLEVGGLDFPMDEKLIMAEKKNNWYVEYISKIDESEILPGAAEVIAMLKENNIKIALASASKNSPMILTNIGLLNAFDAIADGNVISKAKPDPEVFIAAADLIGISCENCIVIEDAFAGVEGAKNAGMYAIGVGDREVLKAADVVISDMTKLLNDDLLLGLLN